MALAKDTVKRLITALTLKSAGNEVATAINDASALVPSASGSSSNDSGVKGRHTVDLIIATSVSQTTDFGSLKVGDKVVMIPDTAGSADFIKITTAGDLGQAAVVGNLYIVFRAVTLPKDSAEVL